MYTLLTFHSRFSYNSQEFSIDIVGEDNKMSNHHKAAASVTCIFTVDDALVAHRKAYDFQQKQS